MRRSPGVVPPCLRSRGAPAAGGSWKHRAADQAASCLNHNHMHLSTTLLGMAAATRVARVAQATRASSAAAAGRRRHAVLPHMVLGRSATEAAAVWQS